jgi:putative ABC transport system substrate-binding protein
LIAAIGGATVAWPLAARAQQPVMPIVGLVGGGGGDISTRYVTAFRRGLNETGTIEGQNAAVEYHWLDGKYDRLPSLMADLARRGVAAATKRASARSRTRFAKAVSISLRVLALST